MKFKIRKIAGLLLAVVAFSLGVHAATVADKTTPKTSRSEAAQKPRNAEDVFMLIAFLDRNNILAGAAALDISVEILQDTEAKKRYFYDIDSLIMPGVTVDNDIHPFDLIRLNQALRLYAIRNLAKTDTGQTKNALRAIINVLSRATELAPSKTIPISNVQTLGAYRHFYTTIPFSPGLDDVQTVLTALNASQTNSFKNAVERVASIKQTNKELLLKAKAFRKRSNWQKTEVENADTRAYAKLFEEELPNLRRELTLLKADIDKGFAELQKQQDANPKATTKSGARTIQ